MSPSKIYPVASLVLVATFALIAATKSDGPPADAVYPLGGATAIQGDADCNGAVNPIDSLAILRHDGGVADVGCAERADTNCDDAINPIDSLRILRFDAGVSIAPIAACAPIGEPVVPPPSSSELIESALAAGDIDEETALTYRVFALFGDDRLPGEYAGSGPDEYDESLLYEVAHALPGMSVESQDILGPFMVPPYDASSWLNQQPATAAAAPAAAPAAGQPVPCPQCPSGQWRTIVAVVGEVRVWWQERFPADEAKAQTIADALSTGGIWAKETQLMGREPLEDGAETLPHGIDGLLDIYLVDLGTAKGGQMVPYWFSQLSDRQAAGLGCDASPNFIIINNQDQDHVGAVTHELFHSIQVAFNGFSACEGMHWLMEATAVWAEDFVAPAKNNEHSSLAYFTAPGVALDVPADRGEKYGRYAFFLWVTRTFGDSVMKQMWVNAESSRPIKAIDEAIPGGLAAHWHEFALAFWNRPPSETLKQMDGITQGANPRSLEADGISAIIDVNLSGKDRISLTPTPGIGQLDLERVATDYYHFRLLGDGSADEIASITFFNPFFERSGVHVQALVRVGGQWTVKDWTAEEGVSFCRSQPDSKVEEVVVIFSNADPVNAKNPDISRPLVEASKDCGWTGTVTVIRTDVCSFDCDVTEDCSGCGEITYTGQAQDLVFLPAEDTPPAANTDQIYDLVSGKIVFSVTGHFGNCNVVGGSTVNIPAGKGRLRVTPQEGGGIEYALYGFTEVTFNYQDCHGGAISRQVGIWLCSGGPLFSNDAAQVSGSYHFQGNGNAFPACPTAGSSPAGLSSNERTFSWNLHR